MKKIFILLALFSFIFIACEDLEKVNTDPDNPTSMNPDLMIQNVQFTQGSNWQDIHRPFIYPGGFMNQWTGQYSLVEYGSKGQKSANYERLWNTYYPDLIRNVTDIIALHKENEKKVNTVAMARILRVQAFLRLTDYYGDIPYSEAGLAYYEGIIKPKYDKQEDIYKDFLKELKEAANSFDATKSSPQREYYYGGDIDKWKKFANSLRLRIAMRLIKVDPALAQAEAEDAIKSGVFTSNSDICFVSYENIQNPATGKGTGNPISNLLISNGGQFWLATELVSELEKNNDPRLLLYGGVYFSDVDRTDLTSQVRALRSCYSAMTVQAQKFSYEDNSEYPDDNKAVRVVVKGRRELLTLAQSRLKASKIITAFDAPVIYMSYAEVEFLIAEAAQRGWNVSGTAEKHYNDAITAALDQWRLFGTSASITSQQISDYLAEPGVVYNPAEGIKQINTQLWILHFLDPIETWSNWRRSGYPELIYHNYDPSKNQTDGKFPGRMPYPLDEQIRNKQNLEDAIQRLGGEDDWTKHVWWDKQ
ncbi:MAG: SusD/RagB family nutrient-binding outer membrane lipoprotein [Dysgonomonas sp.]